VLAALAVLAELAELVVLAELAELVWLLSANYALAGPARFLTAF
jgi:hypothetical protein